MCCNLWGKKNSHKIGQECTTPLIRQEKQKIWKKQRLFIRRFYMLMQIAACCFFFSVLLTYQFFQPIIRSHLVKRLITFKGVLHPWALFWKTFCIFSQKIKQLRTKYSMDLVRNVPRNSKNTVLIQLRPLLWSYSAKCELINILYVLNHKSITTWVSEIPVQ